MGVEQLIAILQTGGTTSLLIIIIVGFLRRWWVSGAEFRALERRSDAWQDIALRGLTVADRLSLRRSTDEGAPGL